ncbi:hypothetical protein R3Q06_35575 [Rhodococcus erythropolis]|uniref:hypothetical protein n=1 Tax=Rhodococcus erythropolis TaxID=1833 RepID=UPI002949F021|nr:hypothetical protein [Rhodococcus erythropolis]MDV6278693.1 hypothetical protein [Rhodococcus erythropolis]
MRESPSAPTEQAVLDRFAESGDRWEKRNPAIIRLWTNAWAENAAVPAIRVRRRPVIYTAKRPRASTPESAGRSKPEANFRPSRGLDMCASGLHGRQRWSNRWKTAVNAFEITFDGRLSAGRK